MFIEYDVEKQDAACAIFNVHGKLIDFNKKFSTLSGINTKKSINQLLLTEFGLKFAKAAIAGLLGRSCTIDVLTSNETSYSVLVTSMLNQKNGVVLIEATKTNCRQKNHREQKKIDALNKKYLYSFLDKIPASIFWQDIHGRIIGCNKQQAQTLGFETSELLEQKMPQSIFNFEVYNRLDHDLYKILKTKKTIIKKEQAIMNHNRIESLTAKSPLIDENNNVYGIIGAAIDLSSFIKKNNLSDLEQYKKETTKQLHVEILSKIRHDLKTPISGICGYLEWAKNIANEEVTEYIDIAIQSSKKVGNIIEELTKSYLILNEQLNENSEKFSIKEMAEELEILYKTNCKQKNIKFTLIPYSIENKYYIGDHIKIKLLLIDILSDIVKNNSNGSITIILKIIKPRLNVSAICINILSTGNTNLVAQNKKIITKNTYNSYNLLIERVNKIANDLNAEIYINYKQDISTSISLTIPLKETYKYY